jgi:gamma-glutamylcyclotransferase (GGCT)/AIG2-like uncharacterized protein YtfP
MTDTLPEYKTETATTGMVAVYGTLKRGFGNNRILQGQSYRGDQLEPARFIGEAVTVAKYPMVCKNVPFPYLFSDEGIGHQIKCEVFDVISPAMMQDLDRLESVPGHYHRKTVEVKLSTTGKIMSVFMYFASRPFNQTDLSRCGPEFFDRRGT